MLCLCVFLCRKKPTSYTCLDYKNRNKMRCAQIFCRLFFPFRSYSTVFPSFCANKMTERVVNSSKALRVFSYIYGKVETHNVRRTHVGNAGDCTSAFRRHGCEKGAVPNCRNVILRGARGNACSCMTGREKSLTLFLAGKCIIIHSRSSSTPRERPTAHGRGSRTQIRRLFAFHVYV